MAKEKVEATSQALAPVRIWIIAMLTYHETLKEVNPLRAKAAEMTAELDIVNAELAAKLAMLKEV